MVLWLIDNAYGELQGKVSQEFIKTVKDSFMRKILCAKFNIIEEKSQSSNIGFSLTITNDFSIKTDLSCRIS
jgi:hypothetical protein